jgi:hypothetical protein
MNPTRIYNSVIVSEQESLSLPIQMCAISLELLPYTSGPSSVTIAQ